MLERLNAFLAICPVVIYMLCVITCYLHALCYYLLSTCFMLLLVILVANKMMMMMTIE